MNKKQAELLAARIRAAGHEGVKVIPSAEGEWAVFLPGLDGMGRLTILDPMGWEVITGGVEAIELTVSL